MGCRGEAPFEHPVAERSEQQAERPGLSEPFAENDHWFCSRGLTSFQLELFPRAAACVLPTLK